MTEMTDGGAFALKPTNFVLPAAGFVLATLTTVAPAWAQGPGAPGAALNYDLIDLIKFGGIVGYIIIFLSVVAVALVVEYAMSIRVKSKEWPGTSLVAFNRLLLNAPRGSRT